ncbi:MAG: hypothetical protein AB8U48_00855 [Anaplasma ovis]
MLEEGEYFVVVTDKEVGVRCGAIIIAAGSGGGGPNRPPLDGITEYEDKSIFYHVSDVSRFHGKRVVIAGGDVAHLLNN